VEKGGDYLFQIKGNQPHLLQQAQGLDALQDTPFLPTPNRTRAGWKPVNCTLPIEPMTADFPYARSLIVLRNSRDKKTGPDHHRTDFTFSSLACSVNPAAGCI